MLILQYKTGTLEFYEFETPASIPTLIPYIFIDTEFRHQYIPVLAGSVSSGNADFSSTESLSTLVPSIQSGGSEVGGQQDPNAWWLTTQVETFCDPGSGNTVQFFIFPPGYYTPTQSANTSLAVGIGDSCTP